MRFFLLLFIYSTWALACGKDTRPTTINGVIIDANTGMVIPDALLEFSIAFSGKDGAMGYTSYVTHSDINGSFTFIESEGNDFYLAIAKKAGYLEKFKHYTFDYKKGESNNITVSLIPVDAHLRISLSNVPGGPDSVYISANSPLYAIETPISQGNLFQKKIALAISDSFTIDWPVASNENIEVFWDYKPLPSNLNNAQFHESLPVAPNDTSFLAISF